MIHGSGGKQTNKKSWKQSIWLDCNHCDVNSIQGHSKMGSFLSSARSYSPESPRFTHRDPFIAEISQIRPERGSQVLPRPSLQLWTILISISLIIAFLLVSCANTSHAQGVPEDKAALTSLSISGDLGQS